ncbi:dnaJ (Hsp40) homolog, subfamily C, member 30b [Plectropomus leopardus]|uniref:dnaJ (Hsp40) homolog, subfamily C, member 30b n=1 Tax=Plectropomus leopardus TaxID=160734 RepID=UPI001C4BF462|nr:dnaJ (Hsp40) homolog, subfamily C, member 30b [Plectropomus leopardus]
MAEVGQRLGSGGYRLSAFRHSQGRAVSTGDSPGSLLFNRTFTNRRFKEQSTRHPHEVQPRSRATRRRPEKLLRVRSSETLRCTTCLDLDSSRFFSESLQHTAALYLSARLQPLLQEQLLHGRMSPWTRGAVSTHPDTFRFPQQLRAFCTVLFMLAEQRSERPKLHPDALQARRSYSWRSDSSSKNAPPLYRSRTSYYDLLKVSPGATQSQIKTAYYKQSFIYHPDKNPGNTEASQRFSEISEAYTVLGNISLRRKYDRGILSRSDVQSAGRPSSKETTSRSTGSPHQHQQQQQHQHRARQFSQTGGKPMFDFDAFYQAHYGEQLQRERDLRARKQYVEEQKKKNLGRWREARLMEMTVAMLLAMAGLLLFSLRKP